MEKQTNAFIEAAGFKSFTFSENGATKYATTDSSIVDQFGKAGNYRGRRIDEVFSDQEEIWKENEEAALRFPFYLRMITRKAKVNKDNTTDKVQNGQGARDESFKRLLWIANEHPSTFNKNLWILPIVGSWKDLWTLMFYDISLEVNAIDKGVVFNVIHQGLACETHVDLIKKFMPRIKSSSKCTTPWTKTTNQLAKDFAKFMHLSYKDYNKLKVSGKAHDFQKIICAREYDKINWNLIPGRALSLLVNGNFLKNHNLTEQYGKWIMQQPVAKFTGYPFELAAKLRKHIGSYMYNRGTKLPIEVKYTLDAQFNQLIKTARENGNVTENVWCCLDTSGSMNTEVKGLNNITCLDVATSLALFFATLNNGPFHNKVIMFDHKSELFEMKGESFCDRMMNLPAVGCGDTNFQSAVEEIIKVRKEHPEIPLEAFPTTLVVVSDMQFNASNGLFGRVTDTNYEYSVKSLKEVFPSDFVDSMKFIWWDCASRYKDDFEGDAFTSGAYYLSGFDGSIMGMLLGQEMKVIDKESGEKRNPTAEEMVEKALSQEILNYIKL